MPCFADGVPIGSTLQHFHLVALADNAQAESINISWIASHHCMMEQLIAHWSGVPVNSENLLLVKVSGVDPKLTTVLRTVDPSVSGDNITDLVCVVPYYFDPGDTITCTYANTDDQDVGVEIFLVEVR